MKNYNTNKYLQEVTNFFIRQGNKTKIETLMYNFFIHKATLMEKNKSNIHQILHKCNLNTTPFIKLKTQKKGKRNIYRVQYLDELNGYKKSVQNVGQTIKTIIKTNSRDFSKIVDRELISCSTGKHPIIKKRLAIHLIARKNVPFNWFNVNNKNI